MITPHLRATAQLIESIVGEGAKVHGVTMGWSNLHGHGRWVVAVIDATDQKVLVAEHETLSTALIGALQALAAKHPEYTPCTH